MLKTLKEFRDSLNDEQEAALNDALPGGLVEHFHSADNEVLAQGLVEKLNKHLAQHPLVAFNLYKALDSKQRALISDLAFDDEEDE